MEEHNGNWRRHYGLDAVRRNLLPFILGRGLSAVSTLIVLLLAIKFLTVSEFAAYTVLHAFVFMVGVLSTFGINALLLRYLPHFRSQSNNRAMYRLLLGGVAGRAATYAFFALALLAGADLVAGLLNLDGFVWALRWYLLVGFLRINSTFLVRALEALLWQRAAQYSAAVAALFKLIVVAAAIWSGTLDLRTFIVVELAAESIGLTLLISSAVLQWHRDSDRSTGDAGVLRENRRRLMRFAAWSYSQSLTSILNGSAANRLIVAHFLATEASAVFGVIDRLIDYLRRYGPTISFLGFIRPLFNARYRQKTDFGALVQFADLIFRLNAVVLLVPFVAFAISGERLFDLITGGKYHDIALLFLGFYLVALLATVTALIDILVKAVEETQILTLTNIVLSVSILTAIPLFPRFGLWALVVANALGNVASFTIIFTYLRRKDLKVSPNWFEFGVAAFYAAVSIIIGRLAAGWSIPPLVAAGVGCVAFVGMILMWPPFLSQEQARLKELLRFKRREGAA